MTFVALSLLYTKHHIMAFAWVTVGSLALLAAKGGYFTVITGGNFRVWGPPGSFIADNNHFALAAIITIPMLHFLQLQLEKTWQRHIVSGIMLLCVASAVGSHSRGALLALGAMGVIFWWRSSRKGLIGLMLLVSTLAILPMMPEHYWDRMNTIKSYEEDASAMGRINAWLVAIEVAKRNPFGAGMSYQYEPYFAMYGAYSTNVQAAHSIYVQILGNHGFVGLFLYLGIWVATLRSAGRLRAVAKEHPEAKWAGQLGAMVQVSLLGFAAGGAFLSMPYFDFPYNLMVMTVLARKWVESRGWESDPDVSFLEYAGLRKKKMRRPNNGDTN
jgi:probable O-glycosylation ligase (exosortase A-associated)